MTLNWLHLETPPLHWLGLVRSIVEPRLKAATHLDIQWQSPDRPIQASLEKPFNIVSWTYLPQNPASNWDGLWQMRLHHPNAIRILLAAPSESLQQIQLLEAGAHLLIPDAVSLCHWLQKHLATEYPHT
jgi:hypothetical protein